MRCPKCGAFIEDGKNTCFMCGTDINSFNGGNNGFSNNTGFSNNNMNNNQQSFNAMPNNMDYHKAPIDSSKDKDFFDFISEHGVLVKTFLFLGALVLVGLIGYKYYESKCEAADKEPLINTLYYSVDDSLTNNSTGNGGYTYSLSSDKGAACTISIAGAASTSETAIDDYLTASENAKIVEWDENGNVTDTASEFVSQTGKEDINGVTWYYLNMFYKSTGSSNYDSLKYRYMGALYKGYFYNIELVNSTNDATCSNVLDSFSRSLEFISE